MTIHLRQTPVGWYWMLVRVRSVAEARAARLWSTSEVVDHDGPYFSAHDANRAAEGAYVWAEREGEN